MARIRVTVSDPDAGAIADLLEAIVQAVRKRLGEELHRLVRDATRMWRSATPFVTGRLRRSEIGIAVVDHKAGIYRTIFTVKPPGRRYYDDVASQPRYRGRGLKNLAIVNKWLDRNIERYVDRAIDKALEDTK